jgi:DNA helicase-2/ATP-dependent DNA helicase PcrA
MPRSDAKDGFVRLFVVNAKSNKELAEKLAAEKMAELTLDSSWKTDNGYECLILEHHMAASRFSFSNLFTPLDESGAFVNSLRKGEIAEISFLANIVSPLIKAYHANDSFGIAKLIRKNSPLLNKKQFKMQQTMQQKILEQAEKAAESLFSLWGNDTIPSCIDVLRSIRTSGLFETSERVDDILDDSYSGDDPKVNALKAALAVPFDEMERYAAYVSDQTRFATHQGVKGLEFPRVMVVLDDSEARGFLFSYEKLFGAKEQTATDLKNEQEGKDTSIRRTARLFYVACTRAMDSLAVVAYSENPELVRSTALSNGWFSSDEIVMVGPLENVQ